MIDWHVIPVAIVGAIVVMQIIDFFACVFENQEWEELKVEKR